MRHSLAARTRRQAGLTLIELLAATAIVGVMVAALIPAMPSAREASRSTVCLSNMHTLGVAFANYSADNIGFLPHTQYLGWTGAQAGLPVTDPMRVREWMKIYYPYIIPDPINPAELTNPYISPDMVAIREITSAFDCPSTGARVGHFHPVSGYKTLPKRFDYLVFAHRVNPTQTPLISKLDNLSPKAFLLMDARATDPAYSWGNNADAQNDDYFVWQLMFNPSNLNTPHSPTVDGSTGYRPGFHHNNGCSTLFPGGNASRLNRVDVQPGYAIGNYTTRTALP